MSVDYSKLIGDGKCTLCRGPLGQFFRRIRIDMGAIDARGVRQHMGLSQFLGSDALADVFSPRSESLVRFTGDVDPDAVTQICLCTTCFCTRSFDPGVLEETVNAREKQREAEE